ncbi:Transcription factor [Malassezia sp. CBS 17886]|nr:Transcription factor [Malassezia sp. CBS 17886]
MTRTGKRELAAREGVVPEKRESADLDAQPGSVPPPKKKQPSRRKVNTACIYCRRSHMTCDENRPCLRCVKRDIGHLCRDEVHTPTPTAGRSRQAGHGSDTTTHPAAFGNPMMATEEPPELLSHDLSTSATRGNLVLPDQARNDAANPHAVSADALGASHFGAPRYASNTPASLSGLGSSSSPDMTLVSPGKIQREIDPSMPFLRQPLPTLSSGVGPPAGISADPAASALTQRQAQPMFGAPPLALRQEHGCAERMQPIQGTQLSGTAWLGLGGPLNLLPGSDSNAGSEINVLSEFLESLDDNSPWFVPKSEKDTAKETPSYEMKPDSASGMGMLSRDSAPSLLSTPPSMAAQETIGVDPGAVLESDGSFVSPQRTLAMRAALPVSPLAAGRKRGATEPPADQSLDTSPHAHNPPERQQHMAASTSALDDGAGPRSARGSGHTSNVASTPYSPVLSKTASKTERFLLTAADQTDGSRDERLRQVIQAKCEAGLLRPYNHVKGYARLNKWMERNVSAASRRRILKPLSVFRPVFVSIAKNLTNYDLIYIEEAFERLLLDYDRVFSIQGIPACLWRRTGEIYKGNKEFAELVGVPIESLREGCLCIYELMAEESAVNYWEKYGSVSFDPSQKAVLTMCKLRTKNKSLALANTAAERGASTDTGEGKRDSDARPDRDDAGAAQDPMPTAPALGSERARADDGADAAGSIDARSGENAGAGPGNGARAAARAAAASTAENIPTMIVGNFLPTHPA